MLAFFGDGAWYVVDGQTRCIHYRTPLDVIAICFACCGEYYPCYTCRQEVAGHTARAWPAASRYEHAVLCGVCGTELTLPSTAA